MHMVLIDSMLHVSAAVL